MGGSLSKPNRIKDVYTKLVFFDNNQLKFDNGTTDVVITDADGFNQGTVAELTDTNITSPQNSALLKYDSSSQKWVDDTEIDCGGF
jgi:hypothetical protein